VGTDPLLALLGGLVRSDPGRGTPALPQRRLDELAERVVLLGGTVDTAAQELGLVDELCGMWEAGRRIHKDLKLKGKFGLRFIKPKKKRFSFSDLMQDGEETLAAIREATVKRSGPAFLLPW